MGGFFVIASLIVLLIGSVMLLIEAFGESALWGLGCLLLPFPVTLLFVITHWYQAKKAFTVLFAGWALFALAHFASQ